MPMLILLFSDHCHSQHSLWVDWLAPISMDPIGTMLDDQEKEENGEWMGGICDEVTKQARRGEARKAFSTISSRTRAFCTIAWEPSFRSIAGSSISRFLCAIYMHTFGRRVQSGEQDRLINHAERTYEWMMMKNTTTTTTTAHGLSCFEH